MQPVKSSVSTGVVKVVSLEKVLKLRDYSRETKFKGVHELVAKLLGFVSFFGNHEVA